MASKLALAHELAAARVYVEESRAVALQVEYDDWRDEHGMNPTKKDLTRLDRWLRMGAQRTGLLYGGPASKVLE